MFAASLRFTSLCVWASVLRCVSGVRPPRTSVPIQPFRRTLINAAAAALAVRTTPSAALDYASGRSSALEYAKERSSALEYARGRAEDLLVWKSAADSSRSGATCSAADARKAFGTKFVNYLARFLLAYDRPSRQLWRTRAAEIPLSWSERQVIGARTLHFGEFAGAIEIALCDYTPAGGKWNDPLTVKDAVAIRRLLTLLRSRYGALPDALRQLALLFSLLPPGVQPTDSIEQLVAEQENRAASEIRLLDGGSLVLSDNGLAVGLPTPALPLPAAPLSRRAEKTAAASAPLLQPTGRVIEIFVTYGGSGYRDDEPPLVSITAPYTAPRSPPGVAPSQSSDAQTEPWRNGQRAAQARAIVRGGTVVAIELVDPGAGYRASDRVLVAVAPPPRAASKFAPAARGKVLLEYEVASVGLSSVGGGYGSSQDLDLRFFPPRASPLLDRSSASTTTTTTPSSPSPRAPRLAPVGVPTTTFQTPSSLALAEAPWSMEAMVARYGDAVNARSTKDVLVLRPPRATLVLGETQYRAAGGVRRAAAGEGGGEPMPGLRRRWVRERSPNEIEERPPRAPTLPRESGLIQQLLTLLPPEEGAPSFVPGKPPSPQYPLGVPPSHTFPSLLYESSAKGAAVQVQVGSEPSTASAGQGPARTGRAAAASSPLSLEVSALPTSISGGVRQDVPLTPGLVARLAIAGGLCSALTRAVTSPIDVRKTLAQGAKPPSPATALAAAGRAAAAGVGEATGAAPGVATREAEGVASGPAPVVEAATAVISRRDQSPDRCEQPSTARESAAHAAGSPDQQNATSAADDASGPSVWLGIDASMAAGFAAGAGSFGTYEFLKRSIPQLAASVLGPAAPADLYTPILFTACFLQSVAAAACSAPFESARVKIMAGAVDEQAPKSLPAALREVTRSPTAGNAFQLGRLWDTFPALALRELPFGVTKLLVYASTQDALLAALPAARERPLLALAVSLFSGITAGFCSSLISHPADGVLTRTASGGFGRDVRAALDDVLRGAESERLPDRARVLYAGWQERCLSMAIIVTAQFILFDGLRTLLAVSKEDLSLFLDVFEDRLDFYSGWDEVQGLWLDAVENLDQDLQAP